MRHTFCTVLLRSEKLEGNPGSASFCRLVFPPPTATQRATFLDPHTPHLRLSPGLPQHRRTWELAPIASAASTHVRSNVIIDTPEAGGTYTSVTEEQRIRNSNKRAGSGKKMLVHPWLCVVAALLCCHVQTSSACPYLQRKMAKKQQSPTAGAAAATEEVVRGVHSVVDSTHQACFSEDRPHLSCSSKSNIVPRILFRYLDLYPNN